MLVLWVTLLCAMALSIGLTAVMLLSMKAIMAAASVFAFGYAVQTYYAGLRSCNAGESMSLRKDAFISFIGAGLFACAALVTQG